MSTNNGKYVMDIGNEMKLKAYSAYIKRQGLDPIEHHTQAVSYLEGETDKSPIVWDEAMKLLKGEIEEEQGGEINYDNR